MSNPNSVIAAGGGGNATGGGVGGRGGDLNSHNSVKDSYNVNNTTINFYGPQFIMNPEGRSLDLTLSGKSITSNPFYGGSNQLWLLEDIGQGKVILKSIYNGSFVKADGSNLVPSETPVSWGISGSGGGYKLTAPDSGLALGLSGTPNLRPVTDKSTELSIIEDTPENRKAITERILTANMPIINPTPWVGSLKSVIGYGESVVNFVNRLNVEAHVYWVAYDGICSAHGVTLKPGQTHRQSTWERHVWAVIVDNKFQKFYTALHTEGKVILDSSLVLTVGKMYHLMYVQETEIIEEYANGQIQCGLSLTQNYAKWKLESVDGKWAIKNVRSNRFLGLSSGNTIAHGTSLASVGSPVRWDIRADGADGTYRLFVPDTQWVVSTTGFVNPPYNFIVAIANAGESKTSLDRWSFVEVE